MFKIKYLAVIRFSLVLILTEKQQSIIFVRNKKLLKHQSYFTEDSEELSK